MADQIEIYEKKTADGETKQRTVVTAADRVAAKFAGYHPKKTKGGAAAKPAASAEKAPDGAK